MLINFMKSGRKFAHFNFVSRVSAFVVFLTFKGFHVTGSRGSSYMRGRSDVGMSDMQLG